MTIPLYCQHSKEQLCVVMGDVDIEVIGDPGSGKERLEEVKHTRAGNNSLTCIEKSEQLVRVTEKTAS